VVYNKTMKTKQLTVTEVHSQFLTALHAAHDYELVYGDDDVKRDFNEWLADCDAGAGAMSWSLLADGVLRCAHYEVSCPTTVWIDGKWIDESDTFRC